MTATGQSLGGQPRARQLLRLGPPRASFRERLGWYLAAFALWVALVLMAGGESERIIEGAGVSGSVSVSDAAVVGEGVSGPTAGPDLAAPVSPELRQQQRCRRGPAAAPCGSRP